MLINNIKHRILLIKHQRNVCFLEKQREIYNVSALAVNINAEFYLFSILF